MIGASEPRFGIVSDLGPGGERAGRRRALPALPLDPAVAHRPRRRALHARQGRRVDGPGLD